VWCYVRERERERERGRDGERGRGRGRRRERGRGRESFIPAMVLSKFVTILINPLAPEFSFKF
jgi:hypothetical protein